MKGENQVLFFPILIGKIILVWFVTSFRDMPGICLSLWEHNVTDNADMMIIFRLLWLTSVSLFSLKELNENPYYKCCGACFLLFVRQKPCFVL